MCVFWLLYQIQNIDEILNNNLNSLYIQRCKIEREIYCLKHTNRLPKTLTSYYLVLSIVIYYPPEVYNNMEFQSPRPRRSIRNTTKLKTEYKNSLQLYTIPPNEVISLQEFEEFAIDRLKGKANSKELLKFSKLSNLFANNCWQFYVPSNELIWEELPGSLMTGSQP